MSEEAGRKQVRQSLPDMGERREAERQGPARPLKSRAMCSLSFIRHEFIPAGIRMSAPFGDKGLRV